MTFPVKYKSADSTTPEKQRKAVHKNIKLHLTILQADRCYKIIP